MIPMSEEGLRRILSYERDAVAVQHMKLKEDPSTQALKIIKSKHLTVEQKLRALAKVAENTIPYLRIEKETQELMAEGIIHDLDEGHAPYRPRYILPDYALLMVKGSKFLELEPPKNMYDAIAGLISMYTNVPSITSYPVYLGVIDEMLKPFVNSVSDAELTNLLTMFWRVIDRALPDAFVHANLSEHDNVVTRKILRIERLCKQAVPNLTLKYDPNSTPKDLAIEAVDNALHLSKPYLVNDKLVLNDWPDGYGVASCYNILPYAGGSFTLVRLNLLKLVAKYDGDIDRILNDGIPQVVKAVIDLIEARTSFIVEESNFFETSYLMKEGFISPDNFTAMFGIYALAEAMEYISKVNDLSSEYGYDEEANELAINIIRKLYDETQKYKIKYLKASNGRVVLHSQAGISSDVETPGIRVKYGKEPHPYKYIELLSKMHKYIKAGTSEIFVFDQTAKHNPEAVLNIVNGAFGRGMKFFSITSTFSEFIRVTGYLIKKEDIDRFKNREIARHDTAYLGAEAVLNQGANRRRVINPLE
jgi:YjjI family glycine radical enzyme